MPVLDTLKKHLKEGAVYRRSDLLKWSNAVDRHLHALVEEGILQKISHGVYYRPKQSAFGQNPPEEEALVRSFLKDDRFLLTSPNLYNALGVGTTQLYNQRTVYNHKRHGKFKLGNRVFDFRVKHHFPHNLSAEFLLVDLVNNLESLAEDKQGVLNNVLLKAKTLDKRKLLRSVDLYGSGKTKRLLTPVLA